MPVGKGIVIASIFAICLFPTYWFNSLMTASGNAHVLELTWQHPLFVSVLFAAQIAFAVLAVFMISKLVR
jgi:hypothetical protein